MAYNCTSSSYLLPPRSSPRYMDDLCAYLPASSTVPGPVRSTFPASTIQSTSQPVQATFPSRTMHGAHQTVQSTVLTSTIQSFQGPVQSTFPSRTVQSAHGPVQATFPSRTMHGACQPVQSTVLTSTIQSAPQPVQSTFPSRTVQSAHGLGLVRSTFSSRTIQSTPQPVQSTFLTSTIQTARGPVLATSSTNTTQSASRPVQSSFSMSTVQSAPRPVQTTFPSSTIQSAPGSVRAAQVFSITVKMTLVSSSLKDLAQFNVKGCKKVSGLKGRIESLKKVRASKITMFYNKREIGNDDTFHDARMGPGSVLFMYVQLSKGSEFLIYFSYLKPQFDYDFRSVKPQPGERYFRGDFEYHLPYGWYRVGLCVAGKYENNDWLGLNGIRKDSTIGEWPVAYHGTKKENVNGILKSGLFAGDRKQYGKGVYTSPLPEVAAAFAPSFVHTDGESYQVIIQVRVNPAPGHLKRIDKSRTYHQAEYWLSHKQNPDVNQWDVRPYGVLLRKVSPNIETTT